MKLEVPQRDGCFASIKEAEFLMCLLELSLNKSKKHLLKKALLSEIAELVTVDLNKRSKYRFLQKLVVEGILIPTGERYVNYDNRTEYKVDIDKLYKFFISSGIGKRTYDIIEGIEIIFGL